MSGPFAGATLSDAERALIDSIPSDTRKLKKWFDEFWSSPRSAGFFGDSTTEALNSYGVNSDGTAGTAQRMFPALRDVSVYARGQNGGTLAGFMAGSFDAGKNFSDAIALNLDCYLYCFGLNDLRVTSPTTLSAATFQASLENLVDQTKAQRPNANIVLVMPNGLNVKATPGNTAVSVTSITRVGTLATATVASTAGMGPTGTQLFSTIAGATGGDAALFNGTQAVTVLNGTQFTFVMTGTPAANATGTLTHDMGYFTSGATAQNVMDRLQTAYRAMRDYHPDVLVFDSMSSLWPNIAVPAGSGHPLISSDGLHSTAPGYTLRLHACLKLLVAQINYRVLDYSIEQTDSMPLSQDETTGKTIWHPDVDPEILEGDDWYKVYRIGLGVDNATAYDISFLDYKEALQITYADNAYGAVTGGSPVAPGFILGDIVSFERRADPSYTYVVNRAASANQGSGKLRWFAASAYHPSDIVTPALTGNPYGFVYRHKYAHCPMLKELMSRAANPTKHEQTAALANPFTVPRRFAIVSAANESLRLQTIKSETSDLSVIDFSVPGNFTLFIPGISGSISAAGYPNSGGINLATATIDAVTHAANQQVLVTLAGVDFRNAVIPQGYLLSAA